ncbi:ABC-type antimicrobial peptide transport system permease subunit [Runella defluvii]|uniref:ABC-type antimicrobial peptide transport system permease subunit n=1 Tax=Runella defluvii TaxID=370973 RepID=A0A7W5ZUM1_9BACT|nr:ABC transporter permease [Runella defluvii]MBB3842059.1 ABC-type antimicrobial peptide transport system permease subunit [Runella defluvii]
MQNQPPRWAERLLEFFCAPHLLEEVQGDLHERFERQVALFGVKIARQQYVLNVLSFIRPFALKRKPNPYPFTFLYSPSMLRNYLKVAFRNLTKNAGYSAINIGGLAVGMAVAMMIGLWIYDELSYDKYHQHYDRLAQVMQHQTFNGNKGTGNAIPMPLEAELRTKYGTDFKHLAMATWQGDRILTYGETKITRPGNYIDVDMPRMLSLKMLKGNHDGLKELNSVLLSASTAKSLFGTSDPMGKLMRIDNKLDVKVTGVYEDLPHNSQFRDLTFIAPWKLYVSSQKWVQRALDEGQWDNNSFQLFAQIADHADMDKLSAKIKNTKLDKVSAEEKKFKAEIFLHPMSNWHLRSNWEAGVQTGGFIQYVWLFAIVGLFVLLLACINFMNLSTARSEKRAKEVGIRKAVGSIRAQLINQFFSESFLVVIFAFLGAVLLTLAVLPLFNEITDKKMVFPWAEPVFWLVSVGFIVLTGVLAGSYPALYLSSFQPVKVLKGTFRAGRFASVPRQVLVVVQFTVSITLIIGTLIVYRQIQHTKDRPMGYDNNGLIMMQMMSPDFYGKYDLLRTELKKQGAIVEMAESSSPLTAVWSNNGGFEWKGKDPSLQAEFATIWVTHDFGKTVGWKFKEGRDFSRSFSTDTMAIVINEAAIKFMGIQNPVGKVVQWGQGKDAGHFTIVGVIKDMLMQSPYEPVKQTIYFMNYENVNWMTMKLNPARSASESVAMIEATFKKHLPAAPFDYKFADQEFGKKFQSEERIGKLAAIFALLAVFISCLGLFGLASFVAEQRTKEIGVRKVLGASVFNLWGMLSKDFVVLVIISCLIAIPIAYYYLNDWLQDYKYHTEISWWIFAMATLGALAITLLTVSYQSIRAAMANPIKSLKSE